MMALLLCNQSKLSLGWFFDEEINLKIKESEEIIMAGVCTRYGDRANVGLMEFCCDEINEVQDAPTTTSKGKGVFSAYQQCAPMGSTLIVGNEGGDLMTFMLFSFGWKQIG